MKKFKCISRDSRAHVVKSSGSSKYPASIRYDFMRTTDHIFWENDFETAFRIRLEEFKNGFLKDWIEEVKEKLD